MHWTVGHLLMFFLHLHLHVNSTDSTILAPSLNGITASQRLGFFSWPCDREEMLCHKLFQCVVQVQTLDSCGQPIRQSSVPSSRVWSNRMKNNKKFNWSSSKNVMICDAHTFAIRAQQAHHCNLSRTYLNFHTRTTFPQRIKQLQRRWILSDPWIVTTCYNRSSVERDPVTKADARYVWWNMCCSMERLHDYWGITFCEHKKPRSTSSPRETFSPVAISGRHERRFCCILPGHA